MKHQKLLCKNGFTYIDDVENGIMLPLDNNLMLKHEKLLFDTFEKEVASIGQTKWLRINIYEYRKDLLISHNSFLYQIRNVLIEANRYYLLCKQFNVVSFNSFLNSFKIEENSSYILVEIYKLKNMKSHEMKCIESDNYVIAESLELRNQLYLPE